MLKKGDHVVESVDDCLHGLLSEGDEQYVTDHCQNCPICAVAMNQAHRRMDALRAVPIIEPSGQLLSQTIERVIRRNTKTRTRRRIGWIGYLSAMAAGALIIGLLNLYYTNLTPSPYDLKVLGQSELLPDSQASLRAILVRGEDKSPVSGVPVRIELINKNDGSMVRLASFQTDADGTGRPVFHLPDWKDGDYDLRVIASPGGEDEILTNTVKLRHEWKLMVSSDKPVYQPGQTIHIRSLALRRPDLHPVAGQEDTFTLTDPRGNVVYKHTDVTSRFGISSGDCPLADEILEGPYTIRCAIGDTTEQMTVEIKKYVLPKFKIDVEPDKTYYKPGDKIQVKISAGYFFGKPVSGADVELTMTDAAGEQTAAGKTDDAGNSQITLRLPETLIGSEKDSGDARITINALVRDSAGQEQQRAVERVVTTNPLRIEVIPESGQIVPGLPNRIYVLTTYADGEPAKTRLAISGISSELQTGDLGIAAFDLPPQTTGDGASVIVRATDDGGLTATRQVSLQSSGLADNFVIRTDRSVYDGGQTVNLTVLGGSATEPVFVDLIKDGQTLRSETVDLTKGRGTSQIALSPELSGTIQLNAYRLASSGLPVSKTLLLYVRPAQQLRLDIATDRTEYRPGETAGLQMTLRDADGHPTAGAISLAAVDEAVFSVLQQRPGMEQTFFTLEQDLLKPIYAIYGWSPDFSANDSTAQKNRLEQALFARASAAGDKQADTMAALQRAIDAGDLSPEILHVLNRPDLAQLVDNTGIDEPLRSMLLDKTGAHSLVESSYPIKVRQIAQESRAGIEMTDGAWVLFAIVAGIGFFVWLWQFCHVRVVQIVVTVLLVLFFISMMLPSLNEARETANSVKAANDLKQIGLAMQLDGNAAPAGQQAAAEPGASGNTAAPPRLREWFPETLLWRPELITDNLGRASLNVDLADSITNWRISASAVSADGRLGGAESSLRVFQPFFVDMNVPVALIRGDEAAVPVVVYNYSGQAQTVKLSLAIADGGFEMLDGSDQQLDLKAGEVRSTSYRLRAQKIGFHPLQVTAQCGAISDAIRRTINVVPDGRQVDQVSNGTLQQPANLDLSLPSGAVPDSARLFVKIYPSSFSQLVEGLDGIFERPYGCFEQTSSTTYPNVLALKYLRQTGKSVPEVEAKAREYIQLGYQRLVSFEVPGGGFDWFGRSPANVTLTAYGLMEFQDMASVSDVDPNLIDRTRQWLLSKRLPDGSWPDETHMLEDGLAQSVMRGTNPNLATTAYVAWSVYGNDKHDDPPADAAPTLQFLRQQAPQEINDPYTLAVLANALLALDPTGNEAAATLDRLDQLKQFTLDMKQTWWAQSDQAQTAFYGRGQSGSVETTALATLAMMKSGRYPGDIRSALAWIAAQKDANGTWSSTQATVLSLKALCAATGKPLADDRSRRLALTVNQTQRSIAISADQSDVMQQLDVSDLLHSGLNHVSLEDQTDAASGYQVVFRYNEPAAAAPDVQGPLSIDVDYDRSDLRVGQTMTATASVVNRTAGALPMVMLDLPIPAGFSIETADLDKLVAGGAAAKYQLTPRSVIVYLRAVAPGEPMKFSYQLTATMPVRITIPSARAYEYYNPAVGDSSSEKPMKVEAAEL